MIPSVNELLGSVLAQVGVPLRFDTPSPDWAKDAPKGGFLSAFLYQVRDETNAQNVGWNDVYGDDGRGHRPAAARPLLPVRLSRHGVGDDERCRTGSARRGDARCRRTRSARCRASGSGRRRLRLDVRLRFSVWHIEGAKDPKPSSFDESTYLTSGNSWMTVGSTHLSSGIAAHDVLSSVGIALRSSLDLVAVAPLRLQVQSEAGPPTESMTLGMNKIPTTPGSGEAKKDPLADRKFSALRLREDSDKPRPIRRQM